MPNRIIRRISSLFTRHNRTARVPLVNEVRHGSRDTPVRVDREVRDNAENPRALEPGASFDTTLLDAVAGRDLIVAGSLELIGLDDVVVALGQDWPAISQRVGAVAERELQRSLDPSDIFRSYGETGFLIHFDKLDKAAAEQKAKLTALRVKAALIDQVPEVADALLVRHFVSSVASGSLKSSNYSIADALFGRLMEIRADVEQMARRGRRAMIKDSQILFSPIWHVRRHVTLLNRCILDTSVSAPSLAQIVEVADEAEINAIHAEVDYLRLAKALGSLHRLVHLGRSTMLLVPVAFTTIRDPETVAEYLRLLQAAPATYRKYIALEITGIASHCSSISLREIASLLERYVKYVAVELSIDDHRISSTAQLGIWAVSMDLSRASSTDAGLDIQLRRFTSAAKPANTFARGASSVGLALAAASAGFTYIDGTGIHLPVREPRPALRLRPLPRSPYSQKRHSRLDPYRRLRSRGARK